MKNKIIRLIGIVFLAFFLGMFVANMIRVSNEARVSQKNNLDEQFGFISSDSVNLAQDATTPIQYGNNLTPDEEINIKVYNNRNKSVVNITTEILAYNWFFEPVPKEGGIGSGSIIDSDGYVLTNYHVIENANRVFVTLWNSNKIDGKVVGIDRENDLAIIQIEPGDETLVPIPVGNSNTLQIGQKTLAIGNPFGLDRTLTVGIVSGLGRPVRSSSNIVIQNMVQTDASINPGNSGGPLLNSSGEMIGVNTIIVSPSRGSVGVGFAVPADTVKRIIPDLIKYGKVLRGWIEWKIRPLFSELVQYADLPVEQGMLVIGVTKRGNADKAGIKGGTSKNAVQYGRTTILLGGDIIVKVNGYDVSSVSDYLKSLEPTKPNNTVEIEYYRNGKKRNATITLTNRPDNLVID